MGFSTPGYKQRHADSEELGVVQSWTCHDVAFFTILPDDEDPDAEGFEDPHVCQHSPDVFGGSGDLEKTSHGSEAKIEPVCIVQVGQDFGDQLWEEVHFCGHVVGGPDYKGHIANHVLLLGESFSGSALSIRKTRVRSLEEEEQFDEAAAMTDQFSTHIERTGLLLRRIEDSLNKEQQTKYANDSLRVAKMMLVLVDMRNSATSEDYFEALAKMTAEVEGSEDAQLAFIKWSMTIRSPQNLEEWKLIASHLGKAMAGTTAQRLFYSIFNTLA